MEIVKTMYLLDVVRNLSIMLTIVLIIGLCALVSLVIFYLFLKYAEDNPYAESVRTWLARAVVVSGACTLVLLFCPSKATLYTYAGLKTAEVLLESDTGKVITSEAKEVLVDVKKIVHNYAVELGKERPHE